jgi:hypothetical protein
MMKLTNPPSQICQSCSIPVLRPPDFGTNADGSLSKYYCRFCYQNGNYLDPELTMDRMIELSAEAMRQMKLPEKDIEQARKIIPTLKRWNKDSQGGPG